MSTRSKTAVLLASAGVLAAGWQIGTAQGQTALTSTDAEPTSQTTEAPTTTSTVDPSTDSDHDSDDSEFDDSDDDDDDSTPSPQTTQTSQTNQTGSGVTGTFTGATATNRYGGVTVTVTLQGGNITDVQARATVYEQHSQRYVQRALPVLRSEVIAADSAQVSNVSGSTYTTQAYLTSLQSALDKAGR